MIPLPARRWRIFWGWIGLIPPTSRFSTWRIWKSLAWPDILSRATAWPPADVAADRARLAAVTGWVVMVTSQAFGGDAADLHPDRQASLIGLWREDRPDIAYKPLPSDGAKGVLSGPAPTTANPHLTVLWVVMALPVVLGLLGAIAFVIFR